MAPVETAGAGAELPIGASAAPRFLKRRRLAPVATARAVRPPLPPALQTEVPGPRRAGLRRGAEVGECAARPSRNSARRRRSKSLPAPVWVALRRPRAIEEGVVAARLPSRAPLRSTGPGRFPRRDRKSTRLKLQSI